MNLGICDIALNAGNAVESSVSKSDGVRVGMVQIFDQPDAVEIGEIQILPSYQGHGIGTRLLRDVIAQAHARRKKVTLSTGLKNHRAFQLYQRLGFRHVGQTDTHNLMACEPKA